MSGCVTHLLTFDPNFLGQPSIKYPTCGKGNHVQKCRLFGDMLVPWRVRITTLKFKIETAKWCFWKGMKRCFLFKNGSFLGVHRVFQLLFFRAVWFSRSVSYRKLFWSITSEMGYRIGLEIVTTPQPKKLGLPQKEKFISKWTDIIHPGKKNTHDVDFKKSDSKPHPKYQEFPRISDIKTYIEKDKDKVHVGNVFPQRVSPPRVTQQAVPMAKPTEPSTAPEMVPDSVEVKRSFSGVEKP